MRWLRRLKEKHWDEEPPGVDSRGGIVFIWGPNPPPLRRAARRVKQLWTEHPLAFISCIAGVTSATAAIIRLLS